MSIPDTHSEVTVTREHVMDEYELPAVKLSQPIVKPDDGVFDVGANIGFHSMWLSTLVGVGGAVLAFEPSIIYTARS